ncbi:MAG: metalloregulator ArsR/SmtB family transcription factor [Acidobacteria bacterium]|nr:metalloregulator ArsR/SmtB family transcription factor [Acidobacteriota bacterium]
MNGLTTAPPLVEAHSIFDQMSALADPLRCRALLVLERAELTVSEICTVLQLPQSTVSRHLKTLADDGWVQARKEATRRLYSTTATVADESAQSLWGLVRTEVESAPAAAEDRRRLTTVLAARRSKSQEFFASAAGEWDGVRRELFGRRFDLHSLLALLGRETVVGDLGVGTGQVAEALAPFVDKVIAVDNSEAMLEAAAARLQPLANIELRPGRLEALPIANAELDAAILSLVLHHILEPERVLAEAARALRPGGRLLVVEMHAHEHEEYRARMGHVWLGFTEEQIARWCEAAGLADLRSTALPAEAQAKGPTLFVTTGVKDGT